MKWLLITWVLGLDCLPAPPFTIKVYDTSTQCEAARTAAEADKKTHAVCRQEIPVARLEVVK